jgi:hypothetical protein
MAPSVRDAFGINADRNRDLTNSAWRKNGREQPIEQQRTKSEDLAASFVDHEFEKRGAFVLSMEIPSLTCEMMPR